jgi:hypothetical protein
MIKPGDLELLNEGVSLLKLKPFTVEELSKLMVSKKFITQQIEDHNTLITALMQKYEVESIGQGKYEFSKNPNRVKIEEDLKHILNMELIIPSTIPTKFLSLTQLQKSLTESHTLDHLLVLHTFLVNE